MNDSFHILLLKEKMRIKNLRNLIHRIFVSFGYDPEIHGIFIFAATAKYQNRNY